MKPTSLLSKSLVTLSSALLSFAPNQAQETAPIAPIIREWTNLDGRKLTAEYLGHKDTDVALKLKDGKIAFVPAIKLSTQDNLFLKEHHRIYLLPWAAWPAQSSQSIRSVEVKEEIAEGTTAIYTTKHFRFKCDVNLGSTLMKSLATVFELTYNLHEHSPLGILAEPDGKYFPALLMAKTADYNKQGGPVKSAGVYLSKEKIFLAPLELMGMESGSAGWRKTKGEYDPSTIIHELTHMLTHEILINLPIWINEGYAEYISNIPIKNAAFQTDKKSIREGIQDMFFDHHVKSISSRSKEKPKFTKADKMKFLASSSVQSTYRMKHLLQMTDEEWATGRVPTPPPTTVTTLPDGSTVTTTTGRGIIYTPTIMEPIRSDRLPRLYLTAHLMIYYFLEIEGKNGVVKIRKFLEKNRDKMKVYVKYREDFERYQTEWTAFQQLPGVVNVGDGRIEYPSNLTPPSPPDKPFEDPSELKLAGIGELLDGETPEVLGDKIEKALIKDLEINLRFVDQ
jgi:hypothetical protein